MEKAKYKRILLKISGEALAGSQKTGYDATIMDDVCAQIKKIVELGAEVGIVVGGGNFWRGRQGTYMERTTADYMGMMATMMNGLALCDALEHAGVKAKVVSSLKIDRIGEAYNRKNVESYLKSGKVVIFTCGTGHPFFSTDTAAALRAAEIEADVILLAKNVDGIYDSDPKQNPNAKKYQTISYIEYIEKGLKAMDLTAITICMENSIKVLAFGFEPNSMVRAVLGENLGTLIK